MSHTPTLQLPDDAQAPRLRYFSVLSAVKSGCFVLVTSDLINKIRNMEMGSGTQEKLCIVIVRALHSLKQRPGHLTGGVEESKLCVVARVNGTIGCRQVLRLNEMIGVLWVARRERRSTCH